MLTEDDYRRIRLARSEGESVRSIACRLRHGQKTIRKVLASRDERPTPYARRTGGRAPKLAAFRRTVATLFRSNPSRTAAEVHRILVAQHGYTGGYDQVRRYLRLRCSTGTAGEVDVSAVRLGCVLGSRCPCAGLCPRERQVFHLLLTDVCEKQAAHVLGISPHTLHQYGQRVYRRLGVSGRVELLASIVSSLSASRPPADCLAPVNPRAPMRVVGQLVPMFVPSVLGIVSSAASAVRH